MQVAFAKVLFFLQWEALQWLSSFGKPKIHYEHLDYGN